MAMAAAFTEADLRRAADGRSFDRGLGYLDCVQDLDFSTGEITATVYGSETYQVSLMLDDGGIAGDCSCPYGLDGNFCKHCVAVGLVVLRDGGDLRERRATARQRKRGLYDWLASLSRQELLDLLLAQITEDRELRRRLELRAASAHRDVAAIRSRISDLLDTGRYGRHGFVEYDQAFGYAGRVHEAAAAIESLIEAGEAAQAMHVARSAVEALAGAYECVDDSSGSVGDAAAELAAVHARACEAARPDPVELADYLAERLLAPYDVVEFGLGDYTGVLGVSGLARVRERVSAAWARNPSGWAEKHMMELLVRAEGDVDALVGVLAADLDERGCGHLRIAAELDAAGRGGEALEWAERGVREARQPDSRLVDYVVARYQSAGRGADAVGARRDHFGVSRSLETYRQLRQVAEAAGVWQAERGAALDRLRADAVGDGRARNRMWGAPVWVDALLDDGDLDGAWQAATAAAASEAQWLRLADAVAPSRPVDALAVYLRLIEPLKAQTGDSVYQQVVRLLVAARACWQLLGRTGDCTAYVAALRADQRRKRNLIRTLDQHGL